MIYYHGGRANGRSLEALVRTQIRIVCDMAGIEWNEDFVSYVFNKNLKMFSIEKFKELRKQYEEERYGKVLSN